MCSVQGLRAFVTERLTAAAAEILGAFEKTIAEYEEEIERQRRLLDAVWRPEVKLRRLELPEQRVSNGEEVLPVQKSSSSLDPEEPGPSELKEEQEELSSREEGEQLVLKQETDDATVIPACEERSRAEPEPISEHQLVSSSSHHVHNCPTSETHSRTPTDGNAFKCDTCGKCFKYNSIFQRHLRSHTGEKPQECDTCGKRFSELSSLKVHLRLHTRERTFKRLKSQTAQKPLTCHICGKTFTYLSHFKIHFRIHTGNKPYSCQTCKRAFTSSLGLGDHIRRTHTGQLPYACSTCGKMFLRNIELVRHIRVHTGERPYVCHICGKTFKQPGVLSNHLKIRIHAKDAAELATSGALGLAPRQSS